MNSNRKFLAIAFILVLTASILSAQEGGKLSLQLTPGVNLPLGVPKEEMFSIGGGAELTALYTLPFAPFLVARGSLDYSLVPTLGGSKLSLITAGMGVGVSYDVGPRINLQASASSGYGLGLYEGQPGGSIFATAEAAASYFVIPFLGLGLGVSYRHYFSQPTPFYQALRVNLGTIFRLGAGGRKPQLEIPEIHFDPVFPVFYKYYDDHPVGLVVIRNGERGAIRDVRVSFFVNQYMDKSKECAKIEEMKKGEQKEIPLYGLFTNQVLTITEGTKVTASVRVDYRYADSELTLERSETLRMYDRNAMTWDDDRRAAAFVTAKDPEVLKLSKNVAGMVREQGSTAVNLNFRIALGLFEALRLYGINYVVDPKTPYTELSKSDVAIDFLQFPVQTMGYKAGDCDDLSILYCALLEATGIETAFITIPGHIYAAFCLEMEPAEAKKLFLNPGDLIYIDNTTWVPVENTLIQKGFLQAWDRGASEWRENNLQGKAAFYPIHEAWKSFEPVGLPESPTTPAAPPDRLVMEGYSKTLNRFVEREIAQKAQELRQAIRERNNDPKLINKLGILYAQYGLLDQAVKELKRAADQQYVPALVNMGNCYLIQKSFDQALEYYRRAERSKPEDVNVLLGLVKVLYELEKHAEARKVFDKIQQKNPDLAARYSYLVSGSKETTRSSTAVEADPAGWYRGEE